MHARVGLAELTQTKAHRRRERAARSAAAARAARLAPHRTHCPSGAQRRAQPAAGPAPPPPVPLARPGGRRRAAPGGLGRPSLSHPPLVAAARPLTLQNRPAGSRPVNQACLPHCGRPLPTKQTPDHTRRNPALWAHARPPPTARHQPAGSERPSATRAGAPANRSAPRGFAGAPRVLFPPGGAFGSRARDSEAWPYSLPPAARLCLFRPTLPRRASPEPMPPCGLARGQGSALGENPMACAAGAARRARCPPAACCDRPARPERPPLRRTCVCVRRSSPRARARGRRSRLAAGQTAS